MNYEERQKEWIENNNVKIGTLVTVIRDAQSGEDGWNDSWEDEMDEYVGKAARVTDVDGVDIELDGNWGFPYYVLEVL